MKYLMLLLILVSFEALAEVNSEAYVAFEYWQADSDTKLSAQQKHVGWANVTAPYSLYTGEGIERLIADLQKIKKTDTLIITYLLPLMPSDTPPDKKGKNWIAI